MTLHLCAPTEEECEVVRLWRNDYLYSLRTPYRLTREMQADFYRGLTRESPHRYWSIHDAQCKLLAFGGLTNIQWENRIAEISLIIDPKKVREGIGTESVRLLRAEGFGRMNLKTIFGEVYKCNPAWEFWAGLTTRFAGAVTTLWNRKFWEGKYWDSLYFSWDREEWHE